MINPSSYWRHPSSLCCLRQRKCSKLTTNFSVCSVLSLAWYYICFINSLWLKGNNHKELKFVFCSGWHLAMLEVSTNNSFCCCRIHIYTWLQKFRTQHFLLLCISYSITFWVALKAVAFGYITCSSLSERNILWCFANWYLCEHPVTFFW